MDFYIIPDSKALSQCAACRGQINEMSEVFGLGVKLKPDIDLSEFETHCIEIDLATNEVVQVFSRDELFLACSESCAKQLKQVLEKEISMGKLFETVFQAA